MKTPWRQSCKNKQSKNLKNKQAPYVIPSGGAEGLKKRIFLMLQRIQIRRPDISSGLSVRRCLGGDSAGRITFWAVSFLHCNRGLWFPICAQGQSGAWACAHFWYLQGPARWSQTTGRWVRAPTPRRGRRSGALALSGLRQRGRGRQRGAEGTPRLQGCESPHPGTAAG